jgi:hypothetical protein
MDGTGAGRLRAPPLLAVAGAFLLLGIGGGFLVSRAVSARPAPAATLSRGADEATGESRNVVVVGSATAHLADEDRLALRALVRDELAAARAKNEPKQTVPDPKPADAPLSDAQIHAYDGARALVDDGIAHRAWTSEDRVHLRAAVASLPAERAVEVLRPLIVAVNQGQVRWDGPGPLF